MCCAIARVHDHTAISLSDRPRWRFRVDEANLTDALASDPEGLRVSSMRLSFAGRLGHKRQDAIDVLADLPEDEEAIQQIAQRFRKAGVFRQSVSLSAPSLDAQEAEPLDASKLEGFVLDALEKHEKDDYVLEEVAEHGPGPARMREGQRSEYISIPQRKPPPPSAASRQANPWVIHLISINEDGSDGVAIPLEFLETTLGREGDTRFPTDAFLNPQHARLHVERGVLAIEDLYSLNGTFLKLRDEVKLRPGDNFLMGRQVLRFERFEQTISPKTRSSDGTRYMGSPAPGGNYKILQIGIGGIIQNVYCLPEVGAVLGREKGDIIFPHDKFMSSRHAQIYTGEDGECYLVDLTSSNGTWIKIWERTVLKHGDYIFMGQQLFRVNIGDGK